MTGFPLTMLLHGLVPTLRSNWMPAQHEVHARPSMQHGLAAAEGREFVPKKLQKVSEWYPLEQWQRSMNSARSAST
jgi:hypothetical protein